VATITDLGLQFLNHPAHGAQQSVDRIGRGSVRAPQYLFVVGAAGCAETPVGHVKAIDDDGVNGAISRAGLI
jgi:hypothetical protein